MSNSAVVASDGVRLAVQEHGDPATPTVVAIHGYPDDHTVWDDVVPALATDHHVVTYDVRGAGASDAPATRRGYHLDQLAADLAAVLDAVSPDRPVHLLGHDWGSVAAWHAVTDERLHGRVASFTSISGPCLDHVGHWYRRPATPATLRERTRQAAASWYTSMFQLPLLPELMWRSGLGGWVLATREDIPRPAVRDAVNGLGLYRCNITERLARPQQRSTDVPVQVLAPANDRYVTPALQASARGHATDLRIRQMAGRHWLPRSRPEVVARCVRELVGHAVGGTAVCPDSPPGVARTDPAGGSRRDDDHDDLSTATPTDSGRRR